MAQAQGKTTAQLSAASVFVANIQILREQWEEFTYEALEARAATFNELERLHFDATTREAEAEAARIEAQRIEQACVAAEQAERQRQLDSERAELARWQDELDAARDVAYVLVEAGEKQP